MPVLAADEVAAPAEEAVAEPAVDCEALEKSVREQLVEARECWESNECYTTSFGYPWQQESCQTIVSKSDPKIMTSVRGDMQTYHEACVVPDAQKLAAYKAYQPKAEACPKVHDLTCVSGRCVTFTESMLQFDDMEDVDDFGSRKFLEPVDVPKR